MIIVVNGMPRSGSTLAFNIAREILRRHDMLGRFGGASASDINNALHECHRSPPAPSRQIELYKCHYFIPPTCPFCNRNVRVIYTYRNPLGALASSIRVKSEVFEKMGYELFLGGLEYDYSHWCAMMWVFNNSMMNYQKIIERYEDFVKDPFNCLAYPISRMLDIKCDDRELKEITEMFSSERMRQMSDVILPGHMDAVTHLRYNHISEDLGDPDAWRKILPSEIVDRVKLQFAEWIKEGFWNVD
jgi:hypothetical protein